MPKISVFAFFGAALGAYDISDLLGEMTIDTLSDAYLCRSSIDQEYRKTTSMLLRPPYAIAIEQNI